MLYLHTQYQHSLENMKHKYIFLILQTQNLRKAILIPFLSNQAHWACFPFLKAKRFFSALFFFAKFFPSWSFHLWLYSLSPFTKLGSG